MWRAVSSTSVEHSEKLSLKINRDKTNIMCINGTGNMKMGGTKLKAVDRFKYLGSVVTCRDSSGCEIRTRLAIARSTASSLCNIWKSVKISQKLKIQLVKSLVWSVALYGCES